MRKLKLMGLAALALFAFGAYVATGAYATETLEKEANNPRILCLVGPCSALKIPLKSKTGTVPSLVTLVNTITSTSATVSLEGCDAITGEELDINLCKDVKADFFGVKFKESNCRSENAKGEKDPIETVLALLDIHTAAGTNAAKELVPIITAQVLGTALEASVTFVCGVVKIKVVGTLGCEASPGLTKIPTTALLTITCKTNATTGDPEIPTCTVLCADVGTVGLKSTIGEAEEDAWEKITLEGNPSKDIFYDD
jgi:hypothetical protein